MDFQSFGFIGGGRITRIMLEGFKRAKKFPRQIIVSDTNHEVLDSLKLKFPTVEIAFNNNQKPVSADVVFLAIHPPVFENLLAEIKGVLKSGSLLVSLAPRISTTKLSEGLGGFKNIARLIPNAPSIIGEGFNPLVCSPSMSASSKRGLIELLSSLGACPEVSENKLEAYAIITAMGPTYLWFQLFELEEMARSFGLNNQEIELGVATMVSGALKTMHGAGISPSEVMDLIPVKPLGDDEEAVKSLYKTKLDALFKKLKN
jgi:pyrroline-5-carboxylate reductase